MNALVDFHFLYPLWFLLVPVVLAFWWWLSRQSTQSQAWQHFIIACNHCIGWSELAKTTAAGISVSARLGRRLRSFTVDVSDRCYAK